MQGPFQSDSALDNDIFGAAAGVGEDEEEDPFAFLIGKFNGSVAGRNLGLDAKTRASIAQYSTSAQFEKD